MTTSEQAAKDKLTSPIAGSVLPLKRAEELVRTLPGVISARIIAGDSGAVEQIHVLASSEFTPKQIVRNVESALIAHLAMRVDHRKVSVATSTETKPKHAEKSDADPTKDPGLPVGSSRRRLYFEDVEVRGSRTRGTSCRVTLRKGEQIFTGEAQGMEGDRSRLELAARATLLALGAAEEREGQTGLEGIKVIEAFEKSFVFAGVLVRRGRESQLLTGTCEIRESAETAAALAVLTATNRWIEADLQ
ncbi:MAG: hypothetical protein H0W69_00140 [Gemmatimonadaceae bacterium]|nr:hypothetical protein [Gemmatimonadaceae bacterium]